MLREKLDYIKRLNSEILEICEIKDIDKEITDSEEINTRVLDMTKKISKAISAENIVAASTPKVSHIAGSADEAIEPPQVEQRSESVISTNNSTLQAITEQIEQNQVSQHIMQKKLPKSVLPKFKGDLTKFR